MNKLIARDCYAQVRAIRRIMLALLDDVGDLSVQRDLFPEQKAYIERFHESLCNIEHSLHQEQGQLEALSK